jgi:hypothetical protein
MATIIKRTWLSKGPTGHKVKRVAYGYTLEVGGKQERKFDTSWSREDAQNALAARVLERDEPPAPPKAKTLAEMVDEYLDFKRAKAKRSIRDDEQICAKLKRWFGGDAPLPEITPQGIAQYDRDRVTQTSRRGRAVMLLTVNRELGCSVTGSGSPRSGAHRQGAPHSSREGA